MLKAATSYQSSLRSRGLKGIGYDWLQIIDSSLSDLVGCTISKSLDILTVIVRRGPPRGFQEKNLQKIDSIIQERKSSRQTQSDQLKDSLNNAISGQRRLRQQFQVRLYTDKTSPSPVETIQKSNS
jgi:hypothetical protein